MVDEDNCYLRVSEMNYFEKIRVYADKYPFLSIRMKLWYIYMYSGYNARVVNFFARKIITNPIFEGISIFIIIINSIFLALEDPTQTV